MNTKRIDKVVWSVFFLVFMSTYPGHVLLADTVSEKWGVGFDRAELVDPMGGEIKVSVWYPSEEESGTIGLGPFEFPGTWNAEPSNDTTGIVVLSHGTGGSDLGHRNLGVALARAGIVAIAPLYPRNNFRDNSGLGHRIVWEGRPQQLNSVIRNFQSKSDFKQILAGKPLGLFGFSLGGYTVISLLTGGHDLSHFISHCEQNAKSDPVCSFEGMEVATEMKSIVEQEYQSPLVSITKPEVCSSVLADPMMAPISDALLSRYPDIPTLLYLPTNENQLGTRYHGDRFRLLSQTQGRKRKIEFTVVENAQHFSFLTPFPPALAASLPEELVSDHPDFDRTEFQEQFASDVTRYFSETFSACRSE